MPKLTKRFVEAVEPESRDVVLWDSDLKGFGLRVKPSGRRTYLIQYRNAQGRSRRLTVGLHGRLTPDQARQEGRRLLAEVELGNDPAEQKSAVKSAPTVEDLAERYLREHAEPRKKPKSVANDRLLLRKHILPTLGQRRVSDVTRADVEKLHLRIGKQAQTTANRAIALLSKAFNLAEVWGWRPDASNPCRHVQRFKERKVERYLSRKELARLAEVLEQAELERSEMPSVVAAIRLLLYTGCRRGEILTLRWQDVDLERRCLFLPDSKTGQKIVMLSEPALQVLAGIERQENNPYVITGWVKGKHLVNLKDPWGRIRAKAGIEDVRIHDLRHTFASFGAGAGFSLPVIGKSLGHTRASTTERYAHLANDPVRQMVEQVGAEIERAQKRPSI